MAFTYGEYSESGDYNIEKKVKYVEYIESDGASYIDTGLSQNSTTVDTRRYEYGMLWNNCGTDGVPVGISQNTWNQLIGLYAKGENINTPAFSGNYGIGNALYHDISASYNTKYDIIMDYLNSHVEINSEGENIYTSDEFAKGANNYPKLTLRIFIGKDNNTGTPQSYMEGRIYYFRAYENNVLIQDLRPCMDNKGVLCMYDEVSQQYFYNQGSGEFVYHNENNLYLFADNQNGEATNLGSYRLYDMKIEGDSEGVTEGIDYVDCLIGDGNSYIDTGIAVSTGYKIEITFISNESRINDGGNLAVALFGASTPMGYSYDTEPFGVSLGLYGYYIAFKNGGIVNHGFARISDTCYNKKYTHSMIAENVSNPNPLYLFALNFRGSLLDASKDMVRIYDFKIYNAEGTLIQHLRPCIDTSKVPCMYDEVSQQYFYNQGTGTFGYKKELRDFQPVLDSNNVPCLMDKLNRKYYYDKNRNAFNSQEEVEYRRVSYLQGDYTTPMPIGQWTIDENTKIKFTIYNENSYCVFSDTTDTGLYSMAIRGSNYFNYYNNSQSFHNAWYAQQKRTVIIDNTGYTVDGTFHEGALSSNITTTLKLFGEIKYQADYYVGKGKIYSFQIYQSDELVFDGIPALDRDNIPCMYDLVTETSFYNQGTGEFSYDIEELECPPVDTLDYIDIKGFLNYDTGLTFDSTWSKIEFKFNTLNNINTGQFVRTNDSHWAVNYFSLRYNYGVLFFISKTNETNSGNFQIGEYNGILQKNTDFILTYTPCNWNINGVNYPMEVESLDSSIGNLILFPDFSAGENRFYSYKVWDSNGDLIQSLVPASDKDGKDCLYDEVNKNILYANGENHNKIGNMIDPKPIKYIESNGTQYIDTGVRITNNTSVDMVCRACDSHIIALDYNYEETSTHYYTRKFACSELDNTLINNSAHSIVADWYDENGSWKWQDTLTSGSTTNMSSHSYVSIRFIGENIVNYVNDYTFVLGNAISSDPRLDDPITLQDYMVYGNIINNLVINKTYKCQDNDTLLRPNLTASEGATLTLGGTYLPYLSEREIEDATNDGWNLL